MERYLIELIVIVVVCAVFEDRRELRREWMGSVRYVVVRKE
jgi:hypothetical protein